MALMSKAFRSRLFLHRKWRFFLFFISCQSVFHHSSVVDPCSIISSVVVLCSIIMLLFVVSNLLATVSCAYNYYSDIDWASAPQQQPYQDFNPSSKYDTAYPDTLYTNNVNQNQNIYDYGILASNLVESEDLFATDSLINGLDDYQKLYLICKTSFLCRRGRSSSHKSRGRCCPNI